MSNLSAIRPTARGATAAPICPNTEAAAIAAIRAAGGTFAARSKIPEGYNGPLKKPLTLKMSSDRPVPVVCRNKIWEVIRRKIYTVIDTAKPKYCVAKPRVSLPVAIPVQNEDEARAACKDVTWRTRRMKTTIQSERDAVKLSKSYYRKAGAFRHKKGVQLTLEAAIDAKEQATHPSSWTFQSAQCLQFVRITQTQSKPCSIITSECQAFCNELDGQ